MTQATLREIPVLTDTITPTAILNKGYNGLAGYFNNEAEELVAIAKKFYGNLVFAGHAGGHAMLEIAGRRAYRWMEKNPDMPEKWKQEIRDIRQKYGFTAVTLNLSTMLACTAGIDKKGVIYRTSRFKFTISK